MIPVWRARAQGFAAAIWILSFLLAVDAYPQTFSGRISAEGRWFPEDAAFAAQRSLAAGFVAEPSLFLEDSAGRSVTFAPFFRYDQSDPRRTHFDLREAYLLLFGEIGDTGWELRLGVDQVFWGVVESQRLVDIVNQVDFVEHPNGEAKLGQPMVHATWFGDWGTFELFGITYHRARTFQGREGRLRLPLVVDDEHIEYESKAGPWHLDLASRYSRSIGLLDLGLSIFNGTSRDPFLIPGADSEGAPTLMQYYTQTRQFGLDAQVTVGSWLLKLEAIQRAGARNLFGVEESYFATVAGGEYAFYSVAGSAVDLSLLSEWNYDARGRNATPSRSPNTLENDVFLGAHFAFNDIQGTEMITGFFFDVGRATRTLAIEFDRRLSDKWALHAEGTALLSVDEADLHYAIRTDSFLEFRLTYNF